MTEIMATVVAATATADEINFVLDGNFGGGFRRLEAGLTLRTAKQWRKLQNILIGAGGDAASVVEQVQPEADLAGIAEALVGCRVNAELEGGHVQYRARPPLTGTAGIAWSYASAFGWHVFPCARGTKVPLAGSHGHHDAAVDVELIRAMFAQRHRLNIAVNPAASRLVVVDVDVRNGGDETLGRLEREHGSLPETPRVLSGHGDGSTHYYFAAAEGTRYPAKLGDGIEVLHDNGYAVLPPSVWRPDEVGRPWGQYRWDVGAHPDDIPPTPAPAWIVGGGEGAASPRRHQAPPTGPAIASFLGVAFAAARWLGVALSNGRVAVRCPWAHEHSDGRGLGEDSSTVLLPPTTDDCLGAFRCAHAHCARRREVDVLAVLPRHAIAKAAARYPRALGKLAWRSARARQEAYR